MNKEILISIQPQWVELILSGKKTVEIRKRRPRIDTPFKCYIYCTRTQNGWFRMDNGERLDGMVVAEFTCNNIQTTFIPSISYFVESGIDMEMFEKACVTFKMVHDYVGPGKDAYGWGISDLVEYEKPKTIEEIGAIRAPFSWQYIKGES